MIDSHCHFWKYEQEQYPWISEDMPVLKQDRLPLDYPFSKIESIIAVQARCDEKENDFLLNLAKKYKKVIGIVAWLDFCAKNVDERIEFYKQNPFILGFRHIVQDEKNPSEFLQRKDFNIGIKSLQGKDISYDVLVKQKDLASAVKFCARHDKAKLILDHLAKPNFQNDESFSLWQKAMKELAKMPHVFVKFSGVPLEAKINSKEEEIFRYWKSALDIFGANRCLWGSDWSVSALAHSPQELMSLWEDFSKSLSEDEKRSIESQSSKIAYNIKD